MAQGIPEKFLDLFQKRAFASLGTIMNDGSPQVTPVWVDYDGKYVRFNSALGRIKDRNVRRDPRVSLSILDPDNPYRYIQIAVGSGARPKRAHRRISISSPRNTSVRTGIPGPNPAMSGSGLKLSPPRAGLRLTRDPILQEVRDRIAVSLESGQMGLQ